MSEEEPQRLQVRLRSKRVQKELDGLQTTDSERVLARLGALSGDPRQGGCEKLANDIYRVRVGDIRIIYMIDEVNRRVDVGGIRRRSEDTYKRIGNLFR